MEKRSKKAISIRIMEFFTFQKNETLGKVVTVITVISLFVQVTMIILLSLSPGIAPPGFTPAILGMLTLFGLIGYRGYLATAYGLFLFMYASAGTDAFSFPVFFHLFSAAAFAIGWTIIRHLHPKEYKAVTVSDYNVSFAYTIVHKEVFNAYRQTVGNERRTTWSEWKIPFSWIVTRPPLGSTDSVTKECPVCNKRLEIKDVISAELAAEKRMKFKKADSICNRVFFNCLFFLITLVFLRGVAATELLIIASLLIVASGFPYLCFAIYANAYKAPDGGNGIPAYGLDTGYTNTPVSGHYIEAIAASGKIEQDTPQMDVST
ncbi:MAG: hypothetical protein BWY11_02162 [Firmicutes bacterium ADurb.Bin182]|nr:MAG: hypothetical protein BWY11_02162 [Firmicutes bacterium ADurb.Bin182]